MDVHDVGFQDHVYSEKRNGKSTGTPASSRGQSSDAHTPFATPGNYRNYHTPVASTTTRGKGSQGGRNAASTGTSNRTNSDETHNRMLLTTMNMMQELQKQMLERLTTMDQMIHSFKALQDNATLERSQISQKLSTLSDRVKVHSRMQEDWIAWLGLAEEKMNECITKKLIRSDSFPIRSDNNSGQKRQLLELEAYHHIFAFL